MGCRNDVAASWSSHLQINSYLCGTSAPTMMTWGCDIIDLMTPMKVKISDASPKTVMLLMKNLQMYTASGGWCGTTLHKHQVSPTSATELNVSWSLKKRCRSCSYSGEAVAWKWALRSLASVYWLLVMRPSLNYEKEKSSWKVALLT